MWDWQCTPANVGVTLNKYSIVALLHKTTELCLAKPKLIANGFRRAGIFPWNPQAPDKDKLLPGTIFQTSCDGPSHSPVQSIQPIVTPIFVDTTPQVLDTPLQVMDTLYLDTSQPVMLSDLDNSELDSTRQVMDTWEMGLDGMDFSVSDTALQVSAPCVLDTTAMDTSVIENNTDVMVIQDVDINLGVMVTQDANTKHGVMVTQDVDTHPGVMVTPDVDTYKKYEK